MCLCLCGRSEDVKTSWITAAAHQELVLSALTLRGGGVGRAVTQMTETNQSPVGCCSVSESCILLDVLQLPDNRIMGLICAGLWWWWWCWEGAGGQWGAVFSMVTVVKLQLLQFFTEQQKVKLFSREEETLSVCMCMCVFKLRF